MTAGVWYDRRNVNFLSTSHPPLLPDDSVATVERTDGANTVSVPCKPYLPYYIKYMKGVNRGINRLHCTVLAVTTLRHGGEYFST